MTASKPTRRHGAAFALAAERPRWQRYEPYILILPAMAVLVLFFFAPAFYNFWLSLREVSLFRVSEGGTYVGLDNYVRMFSDADTGSVLWNTLFWLTFVTVAIRLVLGVGFAMLLNTRALRRFRVQGIARSLMLIPWITPPVVAVAAWQWLLHPRYGAFNQILLDLGIINQGIAVFAQTSTVWWGIVAIIVWRELPFVVISVIAGLQSIPEEIYESARMDGAGPRQLFVYMTLPMLRPVLVVTTLLMTIWSFNNFLYVWLATRGGPGTFTQVLATQLFVDSFVEYQLGLGAAVGSVMSSLMLLFAIVYFITVFRRSFQQAGS
jgi:multiple sugar transport system permease protein